jgi:molecular chaperone DnaJ
MAQRNFYIVLGIPSDASPDMIRAAYRALAKQYHPDRIGPRGTSQFREITEAYRVLSDPESRSAHNQALRLRPASERYVVEPLAGERAGGVEPLVAEPIAIRRSFHTSHPSVEEDFLDWTRRYFTESHVPKSGRHRHADLEVVLSPEEAEIGGVLPIQVPAFGTCPTCDGRGRDWFSICLACGGAGVIEGRRTLRLRIPALVPDGASWEVAVPEGGLLLRVRIRVDPFGW